MMTDETTPETAQPAAQETDPAIVLACAIARGEAEGPQEPCGEMIAAHKDANARGRIRSFYYRMRWNGSGWDYISNERIPVGGIRASERRVTVRAEVYVGDLLITHDRGGPVDDTARLVLGTTDEDEVRYVACDVVRRRDGKLSIKLPDGEPLIAPNPRK